MCIRDRVGNYGLDAIQDSLKTGQRVSQVNQVVHGTSLKLVIKGQSYIEAGNLIEFNLTDVNTANTDNPKDPRFSGNYIITKIRHQVTNNQYKMILECAKDSVATPYQGKARVPDAIGNNHINKTNRSLEIEEIDSDIGY